VTAKGKGKNHYGVPFSKKHKAAMLEFTKTVWLQDSTTSLKNLLRDDVVAAEMLVFLKAEYGEAQLEFYLEASSLAKMAPGNAKDAATLDVYRSHIVNGGGTGIGAQERTAGTQQMWDMVNQQDEVYIDPASALRKIEEEADVALRMMAFDVFPRFLKSKHMSVVMQRLRESGNTRGADQVQNAVTENKNMLPKDADDWINNFVSIAETFPACIVISDMCIPGAPMIYVNPEFCRTTGYTQQESIGRNCRFLQGPLTEVESIAVIRNTLSKGQDCHVKLTNYKKNGTLFQNLLSMKPVFDADGIYRYVIGVQFEVLEDDNLKNRLVQLDKLLRLLPSKLPGLRSKAKYRAKGKLAANVTGQANELIKKKDQVKAFEKRAGQVEAMDGAARPRALEGEDEEPTSQLLDYTNTVFHFTRVMWSKDPHAALTTILGDSFGAEIMKNFASNCSELIKHHVLFVIDAMEVANANSYDRDALLYRMHRSRNHNQLFYCTTNEIEYGQLPYLYWTPIADEIEGRLHSSVALLAEQLMPAFLNSKWAVILIEYYNKKGGDYNDPRTPKVASTGLNNQSDEFWFDMFKRVSEMFDFGIAISDMTIPGIPLNYVNEGFTKQTGYGKEKIGANCRFLQGPETESYLNEEICEALRNGSHHCVKLHNYHKSGQKIQMLVCMHPVHGPNGGPGILNDSYKYQVGCQIWMREGMEEEMANLHADLERFMRYLPSSLDGRGERDMGLMPTTFNGDETALFRHDNITPASMKEVQAVPVPIANPATSVVVAKTVAPVTAKGKGKDHYGNRFSKRQNAAMLHFTKTVWLQDAELSLKRLLVKPVAQQYYREFLAKEYADAQIDFVVRALNLESMTDPTARDAEAVALYKEFVMGENSKLDGIGQQERTEATQAMWDNVNMSVESAVAPYMAVQKVMEELDSTLRMLAFDSFPRFMKTQGADKMIAEIRKDRSAGGAGDAQINEVLSAAGAQPPQDADSWLNNFITIGETFPACIVISDMTIPGAPMVYVNPEFCRTTGYSKEEATGRNCRFLQGPLTEPESIAVIRNTLAKGEDCHVKLTNYKKNGTLFQNLLSMKPVFDADGIYRYVIGVQFEVVEDENLKARLVQLDKLLKMLPRKLPMKSRPEAAARGRLAANVTGQANEMINQKEEIMAEGLANEGIGGAGRPQKIMDAGGASSMRQPIAMDKTVFGMSKIVWKADPTTALSCLMQDQSAAQAFAEYVGRRGSALARTHVEFLTEWAEVSRSHEPGRQLRRFLLKKNNAATYYATTIEITWGPRWDPNFSGPKEAVPITVMPSGRDQRAWEPILANMEAWSSVSLRMLAEGPYSLFSEFLDSQDAWGMFQRLYNNEKSGYASPLTTVAHGLDPFSSNLWLECFKVVSEKMSCGAVVSDMTIPGIPLNYINEGFKAVTGYGKEKIGTSCRFLQGPDTEEYLNDEIVEALRNCEPLHIKLHNHKKGGSKFQCLFALHPVFGANAEYKYAAGFQTEFNSKRSLYQQLAQMDNFMKYVPKSMDGAEMEGYEQRVDEVHAAFAKLEKQVSYMPKNQGQFIVQDTKNPYVGVADSQVKSVEEANRIAVDANLAGGMKSGAADMTALVQSTMQNKSSKLASSQLMSKEQRVALEAAEADASRIAQEEREAEQAQKELQTQLQQINFQAAEKTRQFEERMKQMEAEYAAREAAFAAKMEEMNQQARSIADKNAQQLAEMSVQMGMGGPKRRPGYSAQ